jgi:hypothetical protein
MANTQTAAVIKYLRQKAKNGFDNIITYLGAEQRFVGALRNTNLNNLEEQYIIGTDSYSEAYKDNDGNDVVEISYHINDATHSKTNYYMLKQTYYNTDKIYTEYKYKDDDTLTLESSESCSIHYGDGSTSYPDETSIYIEETGDDESAFIFSDSDNTLTISPNNFNIEEEDELHYITDEGETDLLVASKTISKKYSLDGNKEIRRENITNHLK